MISNKKKYICHLSLQMRKPYPPHTVILLVTCKYAKLYTFELDVFSVSKKKKNWMYLLSTSFSLKNSLTYIEVTPSLQLFFFVCTNHFWCLRCKSADQLFLVNMSDIKSKNKSAANFISKVCMYSSQKCNSCFSTRSQV